MKTAKRRRSRRPRAPRVPRPRVLAEPGSHAACVAACAAWAAWRWGVVLAEYVCSTRSGEVPDVLAFGKLGASAVIEVKVSRADFLADKKKPFRVNPHAGAGQRRYYACPPGLIKPADLPDGWGLLYVHPSGVVRTEVCPVNSGFPPFAACGHTERDVLYSLARRAHLRGLLPGLQAPLETP